MRQVFEKVHMCSLICALLYEFGEARHAEHQEVYG